MTTSGSRPRASVVAVVIAVSIGLGANCSGFREDEIECERAVVHLGDCCPGFAPSDVDCSYTDHVDCASQATGADYPALSLDDSRCLQERSCAELVADGDCERAELAGRASGTVDDGTGGRQPSSGVCAH